MQRTAISVLALSLFTLSLAATASALPLFVELKIREPLSAVTSTGTVADDQLVVPEFENEKGKGNGAGAGKGNNGNGGKSADPLSKANLKSLTLWISADGKAWKQLGGEVVDLTSQRITARIDSKGDTSTGDAMATFGLPTTEVTEGTSPSYYIGVSTSSTGVADGAYSAELVSWSYFSASGQSVTIPEPAAWPLFAMGALGIGMVLGKRKRI